MTIVPAVLAHDIASASQALGAYQRLSALVHVDVLDNTLVSGTTITPSELPLFARGSIVWHLMVRNPQQYFDDCFAHATKAVIIHAELGRTCVQLAHEIHERGALAGLALNPETPVELIETWLPAFDWVQIMTVNPGQQGNEFLAAPLEKLTQLAQAARHTKLIVDGGVNPHTLRQVLAYRPAMITVGSFLAPGSDLPARWRQLIKFVQQEGRDA